MKPQRRIREPLRHAARITAAGVAFLVLTLLATPAPAQQVTMETLLDRIQIEDLLTHYY